MSLLGQFLEGMVLMVILYGLEGLIGKRAVGLLILGFFALAITVTDVSASAAAMPMWEMVVFAAGCVFGIMPGIGLRNTIRWSEDESFIWGLLGA